MKTGLKTGQGIEFCSAVQQVHISSCFPYAWTSGSHNLMPEQIGVGLELPGGKKKVNKQRSMDLLAPVLPGVGDLLSDIFRLASCWVLTDEWNLNKWSGVHSWWQ